MFRFDNIAGADEIKPADIGGPDKAGLVTTAGDAPIALDVAAGALSVAQDVSAHGAGSVDLRTGGSGNAIAIDGASLRSTTGQVQVIGFDNIEEAAYLQPPLTTMDSRFDAIVPAVSARMLMRIAGRNIEPELMRIPARVIRTWSFDRTLTLPAPANATP